MLEAVIFAVFIPLCVWEVWRATRDLRQQERYFAERLAQIRDQMDRIPLGEDD